MKQKTSVVSNVWFKQIQLDYIGDEYGGHSHIFDHQHLLCLGEVDVTIEGVTTRFAAPRMIFIQKEKKHSIVAVTPKTLGFCIHPIRDGDRVQDIVDPDGLPANYDLAQWDNDRGSKGFVDETVYPEDK